MNTTTREQWLIEASKFLDRLIESAGFEPKPVRPSVGFPSKRALSKAKRVIGQCWASSCSGDGAAQIFIHPTLTDSVEVLGVLLHEQAHAAVGTECGHKGPFAKLARAVGLEGKLTATVPGDTLTAKLSTIAAALGAYPQSTFTPGLTHKPQGTRMIKVVCGECGYAIRTTQKWIDIGVPTCPCGLQMEVAS